MTTWLLICLISQNIGDLCHRSMNDRDLFYSEILMYSYTISMPKSSTISKKSYVLAFSYVKAPENKLDSKKIKVNPRLSLNSLNAKIFNVFQETLCSSIFLSKARDSKFDHKSTQGHQKKVSIVLMYLMQHTTFPCPGRLVVQKIFQVFIKYGHCIQVVHVTLAP